MRLRLELELGDTTELARMPMKGILAFKYTLMFSKLSEGIIEKTR